ncbi:MAG: transmembrane protein [bacterium]|nr:MAG: transmembrane protein [bacterium]KAF0147699.1 MAG: transmembrane protein [bacterium]KAF0166785.1 MAG: transmembrane protein [bacterium]TXT22841.1 MAG: transmembrane protein [bacterium]
MTALKRYFLTGLLILVPLGITVWVMTALFGLLDQSLLLLPEKWRPEAWLGFRLPGLGLILTAAVILATGILAANLIGQRLVAFWEGVFKRIPVVKSIYGSVKQVSDSLLTGSGMAFKKVLLVHYPHPDAWSLAFQTNVPDEVDAQLNRDFVAVFIPTTPSPVNGFYFYVRRDAVIELDMSIDAAFKAIVSMGVVSAPIKPAIANYPGD